MTHDGGKSWQQATLPAPAGTTGDIRFFSDPVFADPSTGLVGVTFQGDTQSITRIYRTTDGGSSWSSVSTVPGSGALTVTIVDQEHWIATDGTHAVHTQNAGSSWTQLVSAPPLVGLQSARFIDLKHGWAQWTDTLGNSHIAATSDDGATWHRLAP